MAANMIVEWRTHHQSLICPGTSTSDPEVSEDDERAGLRAHLCSQRKGEGRLISVAHLVVLKGMRFGPHPFGKSPEMRFSDLLIGVTFQVLVISQLTL